MRFGGFFFIGFRLTLGFFLFLIIGFFISMTRPNLSLIMTTGCFALSSSSFCFSLSSWYCFTHFSLILALSFLKWAWGSFYISIKSSSSLFPPPVWALVWAPRIFSDVNFSVLFLPNVALFISSSFFFFSRSMARLTLSRSSMRTLYIDESASEVAVLFASDAPSKASSDLSSSRLPINLNGIYGFTYISSSPASSRRLRILLLYLMLFFIMLSIVSLA